MIVLVERWWGSIGGVVVRLCWWRGGVVVLVERWWGRMQARC